MKITEVRDIARARGLKPAGNVSKAQLIRAIQRHEGNFDCFGRAEGGRCDQTNCLWRADCLPEPKTGKA